MAFCRDRKGENMQEEFLIGEMAELLGVSRDTLRIYEEQGILKPKRDENGFRKYTPEDLGRLIGIRCYRGSYLPMREIRRLFESSSPEVRTQVLEEQLRLEEQALLQHQKNIRRLQLARSYYRAQQEEMEPVVCEMEPFYALTEVRGEFFETVMDYFSLGREDDDMTLCYLNAEYDLSGDLESPGGCYLMLKERELRELGREELLREDRKIAGGRSLRMSCISEKPFPGEEQLRAVQQYAEEQELKLSGKLHSYFLNQFEEAGAVRYLIQMFAPLA